MLPLETVLNETGANAVAFARATLAQQGRNATGKTSQSLEYRVTETQRGYRLDILGKPTSVFTDQGRGAGKQPPTSALLEWLKARNIPIKAAFAIARAIGERGTIKPASNFVELTAEHLRTELGKAIKTGIVASYQKK